MNIRFLINRAYMQVGDTSHLTYTPYQFLEFYNEGNQILHALAEKYMPMMFDTSAGYKGLEDPSGYPSELESMLVAYMAARIVGGDMSFTQNWENQLYLLGRQQNGSNTVMSRGYYDYDRIRNDYSN